jgi:hypothetical protein
MSVLQGTNVCENLERNEAYEDMEYLRFSYIILKLKVGTMAENSQTC